MDWGERITENIDPFGDAGTLKLRPVKTARNWPNGQTEEGCQERRIESCKQLWHALTFAQYIIIRFYAVVLKLRRELFKSAHNNLQSYHN